MTHATKNVRNRFKQPPGEWTIESVTDNFWTVETHHSTNEPAWTAWAGFKQGCSLEYCIKIFSSEVTYAIYMSNTRIRNLVTNEVIPVAAL